MQNIKCTKCNSDNLIHYRGFSGWDFFKICMACENIDQYAVADMQAQEGNGPSEYLICSGEKAKEEFEIMNKCFELERAEEGWQNTNGGAYAKYDRITHTAKNLLNNEKIQ